MTHSRDTAPREWDLSQGMRRERSDNIIGFGVEDQAPEIMDTILENISK